ncbi:hypothetical protein LLG95_07530 [bacterium]|nr:hypothetical protein [bacterium]
MQRREKIFLAATILVVGSLLLYQFVLADWIESGESGGSGELSGAVQDVRDCSAILKQRGEIEGRYSQLALASETSKGSSPEDIFNKDLYNKLTEDFKILMPRMQPARFEIIPKVPDYYFIKIKVDGLSGPPRQMLTLLQELQKMGLIITNFQIERESDRDAGQVRLNFEVARLVKHTEKSRQSMAFMYR